MSSTPKINDDEVVLVVPQKSGGYTVYSLHATTTAEEAPLPPRISSTHIDKPSEGLMSYLVEPSHLPAHLGGDLHVVVSTGSGTGQAQVFYDNVLEHLLSALDLHAQDPATDKTIGYHLETTKDSKSVQEFGRKTLSSISGEPISIILLSGDGGVVDLLNCKSEALELLLDNSSSSLLPPIVALIPLGTGNALFHSIHKRMYYDSSSEDDQPPHPLVLALRTLFVGIPRKLPAFKAAFSAGARLVPTTTTEDDMLAADDADEEGGTGEGEEMMIGSKWRIVPNSALLGAIVASYGFHASLVCESDTPELRGLGAKRFAVAAGELMKIGHAYEATVGYVAERKEDEGKRKEDEGERKDNKGEEGGWEWNGVGEEKHGYVMAAQVSNMEKGFCISPSSTALDGRLWLVHFGAVGGDRVMKIMYAVYAKGSHVGMEEVRYLPVEKMRVTVREKDARWRKVCVDGTIIELEENGWMEVSVGYDSGVRVLVPGIVADQLA